MFLQSSNPLSFAFGYHNFHSYAHFPVRITQLIALQQRIILLDGKITTLVEQRKRWSHLLWRNIKVINPYTFLLNIHHSHMILLQSLDEITWRTGTEPISRNLFVLQGLHKTERIEYIFWMITEMIAIIIWRKFTYFSSKVLPKCFANNSTSGFISFRSSVLLIPQIAEYWSNMLILSRLLISLKILNWENLVIPVIKTKRNQGSKYLIGL